MRPGSQIRVAEYDSAMPGPRAELRSTAFMPLPQAQVPGCFDCIHLAKPSAPMASGGSPWCPGSGAGAGGRDSRKELLPLQLLGNGVWQPRSPDLAVHPGTCHSLGCPCAWVGQGQGSHHRLSKITPLAPYVAHPWLRQ